MFVIISSSRRMVIYDLPRQTKCLSPLRCVNSLFVNNGI